MQFEQRKFLQQHKLRADSYSKAAATMKKQRKKKNNAQNADKEIKVNKNALIFTWIRLQSESGRETETVTKTVTIVQWFNTAWAVDNDNEQIYPGNCTEFACILLLCKWNSNCLQ